MPPKVHPAKGELANRRITIRQLSQEFHRSEGYISRCLNGYLKPSAGLRAAIAEKLGLPEDQLFHADGDAA